MEGLNARQENFLRFYFSLFHSYSLWLLLTRSIQYLILFLTSCSRSSEALFDCAEFTANTRSNQLITITISSNFSDLFLFLFKKKRKRGKCVGSWIGRILISYPVRLRIEVPECGRSREDIHPVGWRGRRRRRGCRGRRPSSVLARWLAFLSHRPAMSICRYLFTTKSTVMLFHSITTTNLSISVKLRPPCSCGRFDCGSIISANNGRYKPQFESEIRFRSESWNRETLPRLRRCLYLMEQMLHMSVPNVRAGTNHM